MTNINIEITPEMHGIITSNIDKGSYRDEREFIREAILQFEFTKNFIYQTKLDKLREALAPGIKDLIEGNYSHISYEDLMAEIDARESNA